MAAHLESWDDDADFEGDLFTQSATTAPTALSSRLSVHTESQIGDDDWQVPLSPNDESSLTKAINSAKQAGVIIPPNVPTSALLGGTIKRLGAKKSRQNIEDDWDNDLEFPSSINEKLQLKPIEPFPAPGTPADDFDDFDEWAEGSLGTRHGGTHRETRNRSSSASVLSPSLGSTSMAAESEDDLDGLVLPVGPLDLQVALKMRQELVVDDDFGLVQTPAVTTAAPAHPVEANQTRFGPPVVAHEDFFDDLDIGEGHVFDTKKLNINRNIKQRAAPSTTSAPRGGTTLTFTDKPTITRIPRPVGPPTRSRLQPVLEDGTAQTGGTRQGPITTGPQLRSKRSAPSLRNNPPPNVKPPAPFLPAGAPNSQSHHARAKPTYQGGSYHNFRRESTERPQSPTTRPFSRLSTAIHAPDTPRRGRKDVAPAALAREAVAKRTLSRPTRRRNFGDGTELEVFDDLPTSTAKETRFLKTPVIRPPPKGLRTQPPLSINNSKLPVPDRLMMQTPMPPQTPRFSNPPRFDNTPRFARDTAASRNAREQRLNNGNARPRGEGPLMPVSTNWKAQVAARSPHTSPSAHKNKKPKQQPHLIKPLGVQGPRTENGMTYNPALLRWEGNENAISHFDLDPSSSSSPALKSSPSFPQRPYQALSSPMAAPAPISPPRPALITNFGQGTLGVQVNGNMVFDPGNMRWLKLGKDGRGPRDCEDIQSPGGSGADDEDDPFAGIDDLADERSERPGSRTGGFGTRKRSSEAEGGGADGPRVSDVLHEEFDVGPEFVRRQKEEESMWRKKVEGWYGAAREADGERWRWSIRDIAARIALD